MVVGSGSISEFIQIIDDISIITFFLIAFVTDNGTLQFKRKLFTPFILLILLGVVSNINREDNLTPVLMDIFILLKMPFLIYIGYSFGINAGDIKEYVKIFDKFYYLLTLVLFIGVIDYVLYPWFRNTIDPSGLGFRDVRYGIQTVNSIFLHPSLFGFSMTILFFYSFLRIKYNNNISIKYLFVALLAIIGIVFSGRIGSILGIIISILIVYGFSYFKLSTFAKYIIILTLSISVLITILPEVLNLVEYKFYELTDYESSSPYARAMLYYTSFLIAFEYFPIGVGFGNYGGTIAQQYYSEVYYEYNINTVWGLSEGNSLSFFHDAGYSYYIGQFGFVGIIIFLFFLIWIYKSIKLNIKIIDKLQRRSVLFAILIFVLSAFSNLATTFYQNSFYLLYTFVPIGIVLSMRNYSKFAIKNE